MSTGTGRTHTTLAPARGLDAGQGFIAADFDSPLPDEVIADFER
jgi:hypothetical protein